MNGDISLSQTFGGLRIANPDSSDHDSPPPPAPRSPQSEDMDARQTLSSSHSSSSTATERPAQPFLAPIPANASPGSIDFNPESFAQNASPAAQHHGQAAPSYLEHQPQPHRVNNRQSMPLDHHGQQQLQYSSTSPVLPGQPRTYHPGPPNLAQRPHSVMYNHNNISATSTVSAHGTYRYRDELIQQPSAAGATTPLTRSSSRSATAAMQPAGLPTREPSRSEKQYRSPQTVPIGNGPAPPRSSSRRVPVGGPGSSSAHVGGAPYGIEGGPLPSSEEWKDKGAAVGIRQEFDANGNPVARVVKKGVKDFNFGRTLGEGSYSTVLAATDRQTLREYAIKVLDKRHIIKEKKVKYVNIEKDTLNRLTEHPGIVRLYYTFQDERSLYFVLDLASGGELLGFLKKMSSFDMECTRFYGAQILDAIDYMHSKGVIHRDLKPENVLLDDQMHVKITDFGTAKILEPKKPNNSVDAITGEDADNGESNRAVSFVGTAEYVSPELLTEKNACKASDLWAFGCIIYQLLSGRPPFKAGNEYQTFQKIVGLEYSFPDGFPEVARDLVERLLVLDPAQRLPMEHIKNHRFFDGIVWGRGLWKQKSPRLKSFIPPTPEPIRLNGPSVANSAHRPKPRVITELPPPSQLDIEWSPVLTRNNERILKLGNLIVTTNPGPHSPGKSGNDAHVETPKKFSRFFGGTVAKKRQRLVMITSSARIVLAPAGGEEKRAKLEIPLLPKDTSYKSFVDSKGLTAWCVDTRDKHLVFEDPKATTSDPEGSKYSTQEWMETIERAKELAILQNMTGSDSTFNDLGSSISSPASTLGDSGLDGVNIPRNRHLSKDPQDTDSVKGRKRFSRRHSKNGLSAVF